MTAAAFLARGVHGLVYGRNIHQHPNPGRIVAAFMAMIHVFDSSRPSVFTIIIDGEGKPGADGQPARPDTFAWGVFQNVVNPDGTADVAASASKFRETPHTRIPITGGWQELAHGVKVRFGSTTGHNKGSTWFVSYDGTEAYGIRIGHGTQPEYIDRVRITGLGTIDMNASRS